MLDFFEYGSSEKIEVKDESGSFLLRSVVYEALAEAAENTELFDSEEIEKILEDNQSHLLDLTPIENARGRLATKNNKSKFLLSKIEGNIYEN